MAGNEFNYQYDIQTTLAPWRESLGENFDHVVATLSDRDRYLGSQFGAGRWLTYVPVLTASVSNPTLGTGSFAEGQYTRFGRTVIGNARLQFGAGGGAAAGSGTYFVSLPFARQQQISYNVSPTCGSGVIIDSSASTTVLVVPTLTNSSTTSVILQFGGVSGIVSNAAPFTWAASDTISINFIYDGELN